MTNGRNSYQWIDERRSKLPWMVMLGMDVPEMAKALGVCTHTVRSDLKEAGFVFKRGCRGGKWVPASIAARYRAGDKREWSAFDAGSGEWCAPCDSREEAMAEAEEPSEVGRVEWFWPTVDECAVMDQLERDAVEFAGECGAEWLSELGYGDPAVEKLRVKLQAAVDEWMEECGLMPAICRVVEAAPC